MRQPFYLFLIFSVSASSPSPVQITDIRKDEDHYDQYRGYDNDQEQKRRYIEIHGPVRSAVEDSLEELLDPVQESLVFRVMRGPVLRLLIGSRPCHASCRAF